MTHAAHASGEFERHVEKAKRTMRPWLPPAARIGYAAKGVVYLLVGFLALRAAFGSSGATASKHNVFLLIAAQPFGRFLLTAVAVGLLAYALWKIIEAVFDPENEPKNVKGYGKRLARLGSGLIYGALGIAAASMAVGLRAGNPDAVQDWTRWGMSKPFGKTLVALVAIGVVAKGLQQLWKAWRADLPDQLQLYRMNREPRQWAVRVGRAGIAARGATFLIIGIFLFLAAWNADPSEAKGLGAALQYLERTPYGPWLLGLVALGLIAYGLFNFIEARYRQFRPPA